MERGAKPAARHIKRLAYDGGWPRMWSRNRPPPHCLHSNSVGWVAMTGETRRPWFVGINDWHFQFLRRRTLHLKRHTIGNATNHARSNATRQHNGNRANRRVNGLISGLANLYVRRA